MAELVIRKTVKVEAPLATLWKVLTDNEFIPQYMFGCVAETDWKPGSPLLWKGAADQKLYVKGHVVAIDAPRRLEYTVIDPNSDIADIPENYLKMTYDLKEEDGGTVLEISQGDFSIVANGQKRYEDVMAGDDHLMVAIKKVAEAQD
ncbi:uncharacterized protein YndB with AHSA1/START domain [Silvibacterium bohemicum]|uniref:Uncharacterized protein YndB with AHSA1/START domain n=1 Tax=Silvibacterium bohemicum TaxID=1577686 RepID=A0A841K4D0_9BACT|nr:SRPBCC domain-containing protein [Silvibacterium bohemicum]MBB6146011.1 uncharacterized protein YndB with AHSA1/START domain [Silvibacterium bohemicum]